MIHKHTPNTSKSEQKTYTKPSFPSQISKFSVKSQEQTELVFDAGRIIHRFREFREGQHQQLAGLNLSEQLKIHLFGFSPSHYLLGRVNISDLVIEKHPLEGRIIMTKQKYNIYLEQKRQEKQLKGSQKDSMMSDNKNLGVLDMISVSSLSINKLPELSDASILMKKQSQSS